MPVSSAAVCNMNTESVSNGLRQFQVRPQLFEAIMMQPTSTVKLKCNAENNLSSAQTEQSVTGLLLSVVPTVKRLPYSVHHRGHRCEMCESVHLDALMSLLP